MGFFLRRKRTCLQTFFHVSLLTVVLYLQTCVCKELIRETQYGLVKGLLTKHAQVFLGIPYAAPPQRWKAPTPPDPWNDILDATTPAPMCYQGENCKDVNPVGTCLPQVSENCLYLNIFAPLNTTANSRTAVMLFIHGGGFEFSSGGADVYNGEILSSKGGVVLVTINYRLGAFGFLVTGSNAGDVTGNYGILDQIQALSWVHDNIDRFGGDNSKVTLFGQSAGAMSTAILTTSGTTAPLFHRIILESLPFTIPLKTLDVAVKQGKEFAEILNCNSWNITCLQSRSASEIAAAQGVYFQQALFSDSYLRKFLPWTPHIDGEIIQQDLMEAYKTGSYFPKPAILGTTSEEGQMYIYFGFGAPMSALEYSMLLFGVRPSQSGTAYNMYKPESRSDARQTLADLTTDFVFYCPTRAVARKLSQYVPVYSYIFGNNISLTGIWNNVKHCEGRVCHGSDIPYVFQSARKEPWVFSNEEFKLSDSMIFYWTNFAKTGNPNSYQQYRMSTQRFEPPLWPAYQQNGYFPEMSLMFQQQGNFIVQGYKSERCDFWDTGEYRAKK